MSDIAIKVEGLGKKYIIGHKKESDLRNAFGARVQKLLNRQQSTKEEFWALKDINFEIKQGEAVGIIGRNGAGKSTLLKILSRITDPTTGRFEINGRVSSLLEVGTGFHMELTGRENIFLNGTILGMRRAEIKQKFDEIVAFSGVEKFIDTPVKHYSSGMKVRLAFSVAAHLEPEILIVDEVLAVGDAEFQKKCLGKMDEVSKNEGRTVLFVSHNMEAVQNLCSRGILLAEGGLKLNSSTSEAIENYHSLNYHSSFPLHLSENLILKKVKLGKETIYQYENQIVTLFIDKKNKQEEISELCLLFYNSLNQRVGIIDLREYDIQIISKTADSLIIRIKINEIGLINGHYSIGLFIGANSIRGDFYNLTNFYVKASIKDFAPYKDKDRGFVSFKSEVTFEI